MRSLLLGLPLLLLALPAVGQTEGQPLGDIYLSSKPDSYRSCIDPGPLVSFEFYVVVEIDYADLGLPEQQETNGFKAWEARVHLPEELTILTRELRPVHVGIPFDDNWIVGIGGNLLAAATPYAVVVYTAILLESLPGTLRVTLGGTDPSSFDPPVPGWLESEVSGECLDEQEHATPCLRRFAQGRVFGGDLVLPCPLPVQPRSWGALKARFAEGSR